MADPNTPARRRRAACAALEGVLGDDELLAALWLQHDSMIGEGVSDIIRYVDAVADLHHLDLAVRKRLYDTLYRALRRPDDELPIDPWPAMLVLRPAAVVTPTRPAYAPPTARSVPPPYAPAARPAAMAYPPTYSPAYAPPYPAAYAPPGYVQPPATAYPPPQQLAPYPAMPMYAPAAGAVPGLGAPPAAAMPPVAPGPSGAPAPTAELVALAVPGAPVGMPEVGWTPASGIPAEQAVFAALISAIAAEIAQTHAGDFDDWRTSWHTLLQGQKLAAELRERVLSACAALTPMQDAEVRRTSWLLPLSGKQLADQVHQLYVALCEALGPVSADQVLTRAVKQVEQSPAARVFSPRKLL
jgi:hypothetical protein